MPAPLTTDNCDDVESITLPKRPLIEMTVPTASAFIRLSRRWSGVIPMLNAKPGYVEQINELWPAPH